MSKLWLRPCFCSGCGPLQRFIDRSAEHEVAAEDLHRLAHRGAHHRLAETADGSSERGAPIVRSVVGALEHLPGEQKREGRGIDERAVGAAELVGPIGPGQLVRDQLVRRMRVRDAQQRLGQAHHGDALVRAEVVSLKKCVDARMACGRARPSPEHERPPLLRAESLDRAAPADAFGDDLLLVRPVGAP